MAAAPWQQGRQGNARRQRSQGRWLGSCWDSNQCAWAGGGRALSAYQHAVYQLCCKISSTHSAQLTFVPTHVNDADDASLASAPVGQAQAAAAEALRHASHVVGAVCNPRVCQHVRFFPLCQGIGAVQRTAEREWERGAGLWGRVVARDGGGGVGVRSATDGATWTPAPSAAPTWGDIPGGKSGRCCVQGPGCAAHVARCRWQAARCWCAACARRRAAAVCAWVWALAAKVEEAAAVGVCLGAGFE